MPPDSSTEQSTDQHIYLYTHRTCYKSIVGQDLVLSYKAGLNKISSGIHSGTMLLYGPAKWYLNSKKLWKMNSISRCISNWTWPFNIWHMYFAVLGRLYWTSMHFHPVNSCILCIELFKSSKWNILSKKDRNYCGNLFGIYCNSLPVRKHMTSFETNCHWPASLAKTVPCCRIKCLLAFSVANMTLCSPETIFTALISPSWLILTK